MADEAALAQALRAADKAGNVEDARKLAGALAALRGRSAPPRVNLADIAASRAKVAGEVMDGAGVAADHVAQMTHATTDTTPLNPTVDPKGLPFGQARKILAGDNTAERQLALDEVTGRSPQRVQRRGEEGRRAAREDRLLEGDVKPSGAKLHSDFQGRDYVEYPDGRKVYVQPYGGGIRDVGVRMGEEAAARPFETAGAVGGGAASGGLGSGMLFAGGGGIVGYLLDQAYKASKNRYAKTPAELALGVGESALMNAGGELVARAPGRMLRGSIVPDWVTGATPETKEFGRELMREGGQVAYTSGAKGLKSIQWKTALAQKFGLPVENKNVLALTKSIEKLLAKGGVTDTSGTIGAAKAGGRVVLGDEAKYGQTLASHVAKVRSGLAREVGSAESDLSSIEQANAKARARAEARLGAAQGRLDDRQLADKRALQDAQRQEKTAGKAGLDQSKSVLSKEQKAQKAEFDQKVEAERLRQDTVLQGQMATARTEAEKSLEVLRTGRGRPANDLQATVAGDIEAAQQRMSRSFATRYEMLDRMEAGLKSSMAPVAKVAKDILDSIPKDAEGKYIGGISEEMAPRIAMLEQLKGTAGMDKPVSELAGIRTNLYQLGGVRRLIPSNKQHLLGELYKAADDAVKGAVPTAEFGDGLLSPAEQGARLEKIQKVRANIEKDYAAYRKKFDDVLAQRLVKDAGTSGSVDAENVIGLATRSPDQFRRIWNIVTPETKRRISRGIFDDMVGKATKGQQIDAQAFVDQLMGNAKILKDVFGADSRKIVEAANGLLAVDGKIPLNQKLMPSNVVDALKTATATKKQMDEYFSKHSLALMASGEEAQNRAVQEAKLLVAKKREELAGMATKHVGEKRALEDMTAEQKEAYKKRIEEAGARVGARADRRIEVARNKVETAKSNLKDFDMETYSKLADPKFLMDGAVDHLIKAGDTERLKRAVSFFGPGSPQVKALQEAFWRKAIASGTRDLTDPKGAFAGEGIRKFLAGYTKEQKDMLLAPYATTVDRLNPKTGKYEQVHLSGEEALQRLARYMDFAFSASGTDMSAGLAAGAVKAKIAPTPEGIGALAKVGRTVLLGWLLNTKFGYKMLVQGFEHGPKAEMALKALDNSVRAYVQTSANEVKPMGSP